MAGAQDPLAEKIAALWERSKPVVRGRLDLLERAVGQLEQSGSMDADVRGEAIAVAHKLAGSLGMFGHATATEDARAMEIEMESGAANPAHLRRHLDAMQAKLAESLR